MEEGKKDSLWRENQENLQGDEGVGSWEALNFENGFEG